MTLRPGSDRSFRAYRATATLEDGPKKGEQQEAHRCDQHSSTGHDRDPGCLVIHSSNPPRGGVTLTMFGSQHREHHIDIADFWGDLGLPWLCPHRHRRWHHRVSRSINPGIDNRRVECLGASRDRPRVLSTLGFARLHQLFDRRCQRIELVLNPGIAERAPGLISAQGCPALAARECRAHQPVVGRDAEGLDRS